MLSLQEINSIFYKALMGALGYDPGSWDTSSKPPVRQMYSTEGAPDWNLTDDVLFFYASNVPDSDLNQQVDEVWEEDGRDLIRKDYMTRVLSLSLIAYGPHAYDHLVQIKHAFLSGSKPLRDNGLFLVPEGAQPQAVPEFFQGCWWMRSDLTLTFNNQMDFTEEVKAIEQVPTHIDANKPGSTDVISDYGIIIKKNR